MAITQRLSDKFPNVDLVVKKAPQMIEIVRKESGPTRCTKTYNNFYSVHMNSLLM